MGDLQMPNEAAASEVEFSNEEDVLRNYVPIWGGMSAVAKLF